ncbi:MAG: FecR family protein [Thermodesulfobacteriota bacterium]|nr:FecR family protein [Thermodesulfobacteriota bacterium]
MSVLLGVFISTSGYGIEQDAFNATLTDFDGEVSIQKPEEEIWLPVEKNIPLEKKDRLKTGAGSYAEILIDDGSLLTVGENSEVILSEISADFDRKRIEASLFLRIGRLFSNIARFVHPRSRFSVRTPTAVAGVRGTEFIVEITDAEETDVGVFDGKVGVGGIDSHGELIKGSEVLLTKKRQTTVKKHRRPFPPFLLKKRMLLHEKRLKVLRKKAIERRRDLPKIVKQRLKALERVRKKWRKIRPRKFFQIRQQELKQPKRPKKPKRPGIRIWKKGKEK